MLELLLYDISYTSDHALKHCQTQLIIARRDGNIDVNVNVASSVPDENVFL